METRSELVQSHVYITHLTIHQYYTLKSRGNIETIRIHRYASNAQRTKEGKVFREHRHVDLFEAATFAILIADEVVSLSAFVPPTRRHHDNNPSGVFSREWIITAGVRYRGSERIGTNRQVTPGLNGLTSHFNIEMPQHATNEPPGYRPYETKQQTFPIVIGTRVEFHGGNAPGERSFLDSLDSSVTRLFTISIDLS